MLVIYFILFAVLGVAHEVFWTSVLDFRRQRNPRLIGHSTLWMFPIYGSIIFIVLIVQALYANFPWWARGLIYAVLIYILEYSSGSLIRLLVGVAPWDYASPTPDNIGSKKKFQLNGLICLEYAPVWFIEGLLAEGIYLFIKSSTGL